MLLSAKCNWKSTYVLFKKIQSFCFITANASHRAFETDKAVGLARRFLEWGANSLKVKLGLDETGDLARFAAVRNLAGPDVTIGFDANCGWDAATARRMMAALEGLAALAAHRGAPIHAVQLMAVASRWQQESGQQLTELELTMQAETRQITEAALDPTAWQQAWRSTMHWPVAQVARAVAHEWQ